jgi:hypothetical protein
MMRGGGTESRIVYVRNRNKRKEWIALICTDVPLSEDEVAALYGKRWSIEVFFKTCKTYLHFTGKFRQTSYKAVTAHTAIMALRYTILAVNRQREANAPVSETADGTDPGKGSGAGTAARQPGTAIPCYR